MALLPSGQSIQLGFLEKSKHGHKENHKMPKIHVLYKIFGARFKINNLLFVISIFDAKIFKSHTWQSEITLTMFITYF